MSRIGNLLLAYAFAAAAMDQGRADYALVEDPWCGEDDAHRKQRLHRMNEGWTGQCIGWANFKED